MRSRRAVRACRRVLTLAGALSMMWASAAPQSGTVELEDFSGDFTGTGTWTYGDGTQALVSLHCAISSSERDLPPQAQGQQNLDPLPYSYRVTDLNTASGAYYLYLDGDPANTGNARILVQFSHRDVLAGTFDEVLTGGVFDAHTHDGQTACDSGDNSELVATLTSTELSKARAGSYRGDFEAEIQGGRSGSQTSSVLFSVEMDVADVVRVASLDNINLGVWNGISDVTGTDTFCVYSNNSAAAYVVTLDSPNADGSGNFRLRNGTDHVPYELRFNDQTGSSGSVMTAGAAVAGAGSNADSSCLGIDNARVDIRVRATDLSGAPSKTFGDTVTILVAPQ